MIPTMFSDPFDPDGQDPDEEEEEDESDLREGWAWTRREMARFESNLARIRSQGTRPDGSTEA